MDNNIPKLIFPIKLLKRIKQCLEIAEEYYEIIYLDKNFFKVTFNVCDEGYSFFYTFEHLLLGCPEVIRYFNEKNEKEQLA